MVSTLVILARTHDSYVPMRVNNDGTLSDAVRYVLDPFAAAALECALRLREGGNLTSVTAAVIGDDACVDVLRTALAMGADRAVLLQTPQSGEHVEALDAAADYASRFHVILVGRKTSDDAWPAAAPYLAAMLQVPYADRITALSPGGVLRCSENGGVIKRRLITPAVLGVDLAFGPVRYAPLAAVLKARNAKIELHRVEPVIEQPVTLGHKPMPVRHRAGTRLSSSLELADLLRSCV